MMVLVVIGLSGGLGKSLKGGKLLYGLYFWFLNKGAENSAP